MNRGTMTNYHIASDLVNKSKKRKAKISIPVSIKI